MRRYALAFAVVLATIAPAGCAAALASQPPPVEQPSTTQPQASNLDVANASIAAATVQQARYARAQTITAIVAVGLTFVLLYYTHRALQVSQEASAAATKSAIVASDTLVVTQRAYVVSADFTHLRHVEGDRTLRHGLHFRWANEGSTPARQVNVHAGDLRFENANALPAQITLEPFAPPATAPTAAIGPRQTITSDAIWVTPDDMQRLRNGTLRIFVYSRIRYRDIFEHTPDRNASVFMELRVVRDPGTADAPTNPFGLRGHELGRPYNFAD